MPPIRSLYVKEPPTQPTMGPVTTLQRLRDLYTDTLKDFAPADLLKSVLPSQDVTMPMTTMIPGGAAGEVASLLKNVKRGTTTIAEYQGIHTPPLNESGAPLHDLTGGGRIYPDDVYSPQGPRYYGTGRTAEDTALFKQIHALKDKPDAQVTIYRAVPKDAPVTQVQHGDWVTISRKYAEEHGESALRGNYKIIKAEVPAKTLFTNGDSPYEYGLDLSVLPNENTATAAVKRTLKAFHGSPHDFDQFSLSKIGTGEGKQAYGHGLYFAENEDVAKQYREDLTASYPKFKHTDSDLVGGIANDRHDLPVRRAEIILAPTTSKEEALRTVEEGRSYLGDRGYSIAKNWIENGDVHWPQRTGRIYEVNIHASPDELLDWDKPLSQQPPKVQEALAKLDPDTYHPSGNDYDAMEPGHMVYQRLVSSHGRAGHTEGIASQKLKDAGIKGIQYLDQGSRRIGQVVQLGNQGKWFYSGSATPYPTREAATAASEAAGPITRNFVIFDDKIIEIAKKFGLSLPVAASLYKWQQSQQSQKGVE